MKKVDRERIRLFLESSPQYPNLLSVVQTLRYAGLQIQAGQCEWDYLKNLSSPFLLHLRMFDSQNLVIAKWNIKHGNLRVFSLKNKRWENRCYETVAKYWDGVILYTEDRQYKQYFKTVTWIVLSLIIFVSLSALVKAGSLNVETLFYIPLILGLVVSGCLYFKPEMPEGGIIDRLCHISKLTDCNRVEKSKYSKVLDLRMDCMAFSFFISQVFVYPSAICME